MRSAARFQLVTTPSSVFERMASSEDSTMAASIARSRSALRRSLMSWKTKTTPLARGRTSGVVLVFHDISERRRAERERAMLAAIVESSDDAILSKTLEGVVTSWNRAAERMYGYAAEEAVGLHISFVVPPELGDELG